MTKREREDKLKIAFKTKEAIQKASGNDIDVFNVINILDYLHRQETTLTRLNEVVCSIEMNEETENKVQKRIENAERRAKQALAKYGIKITTQRDPRGNAVRLHLKELTDDKYFNSWDGETTVLCW